MLTILLLLACTDPADTGADTCETAADCPDGERCWAHLSEDGDPLGSVCGVCAEEGGEYRGEPTCLELE